MITVIPAIDIIDGKCVRLTQGDYQAKTVYADDPLEVAKGYEAIGIERLHVVDLDGAKLSKPSNLNILERIARQTSLDVQWGGGIKSLSALRRALDAGASRVICGSVAVTAPDEFAGWIAEFGANKIILGADIKDGYVATHGWLKGSEITAEDIIQKFKSHGLTQAIVTDISKDGMLMGPNFEMYEKLQRQFATVNITVSGGISSMQDIEQLDAACLRSVIVGKAIYEGRITLKALEEWLLNE